MELTVRVEVADFPELRLTLVGLADAERPEGETKTDSVIVPENLLRLVIVMVAVALDPACRTMFVGLEDMLKSG